MAEIVERNEPVDAVWSGDVFCPLGDGDLDLPGVLEALRTKSYRGWIVVEQDSLRGKAGAFEATSLRPRGESARAAATGLLTRIHAAAGCQEPIRLAHTS